MNNIILMLLHNMCYSKIGSSMIRKLCFVFNIITFLSPIFSWGQDILVKSSIPTPIETKSPIQVVDPYLDDFLHFDVHLINKGREQELSQAVHCFPRLENYRFVDVRRRIVLSEGMGYIVLYSAKELQEQTGRSIRPQNIREIDAAMNIEFVLTDQGEIKEKVVIHK